MTTPLQGSLRGEIDIAIRAGTLTLARPLEGRIVGVPAKAASMIREGPAGSVAVHAPSALVLTTVAGVNAPEPFCGAVSTLTLCPASGSPALLSNSPYTLTRWPWRTFSLFVLVTLGALQTLRSAR